MDECHITSFVQFIVGVTEKDKKCVSPVFLYFSE